MDIEPDRETFVTNPGSRDISRKFFRSCADQFPDGSTGRKLFRYFKERKFRDVTIHPELLVLHDVGLFRQLMNVEQFLAAAQEQGVLVRDEAEKWQRELKAANEEGRFTFAGRVVEVKGRK